jgi:hypothetical protein
LRRASHCAQQSKPIGNGIIVSEFRLCCVLQPAQVLFIPLTVQQTWACPRKPRRAHVGFLASDEMKGREAGTPNTTYPRAMSLRSSIDT